ncbi:MAG: hypothetical protein IID40_00390 [Planctomycetes bacterium]|nr:hypothetical protein [Planctomycetota bacterium]
MPLSCMVHLGLWACALPVGAQSTGRDDSSTGDVAASTQDDGATPAAESQPGATDRELDLSSPQAAVREFLLAHQDAEADKPQRIDDAARCMDLSGLEEATRAEQGRSRALRLQAVIAKTGVQLDDLPQELPEGQTTYLFYPADPAPDAPAIRLARHPQTGQWLFTAATVAAIADLEKAIQQAIPADAPEDTAVTAARRTPAATMRTFIEAMNAKPRDSAAAVECLNAEGRDAGAWAYKSRETAVKLKTVMDKIKRAVYPDIQVAPSETTYIWHTDPAGTIAIGRIDDGLHKGEWRFTKQTVDAIDALYAAYEKKPIIAELSRAGIREELTFALWLDRTVPASLRSVTFSLKHWQ